MESHQRREQDLSHRWLRIRRQAAPPKKGHIKKYCPLYQMLDLTT